MSHFLAYNSTDTANATAMSWSTLGDDQSITIGTLQPGDDATIIGTVWSDQSGGSLYLDQSFDNVNFDYTTTVGPLTASTGQIIQDATMGGDGGIPVIGTFVRVRYTNGTTAGANLRVFIRTIGSRSS